MFSGRLFLDRGTRLRNSSEVRLSISATVFERGSKKSSSLFR